jgi:SNF2 family DNA or RNA helicase
VRDRTRQFLDAHPELEGEALMSPIVALRQAANSTELVPEGESLSRPSSAKVERLKELLDGELRGEQVIIFSDFEKFVRILMRELRKHEPVSYTGPMSDRERSFAIDAFTRGRRRVLIGTKAIERGHNLQCAALAVNADLPWNPAALKQRLGRLRRLESKHQVIRIRDLAAEDTVETKLIAPKLDDKHKLAEDVLGEDELSRPAPDHAGLTSRNVRDKI